MISPKLSRRRDNYFFYYLPLVTGHFRCNRKQ